MSRYKQYRQTQNVLVIFLTCMFVAGGLALTNAKGNNEWFPFYSWSMFGLVPQEETNYRVMIETPSGNWMDFRQAEGLVHQHQSLQAYHVIQKLGRAINAANEIEIAELSHSFATAYLKPGTRYQIVKIKEDPLTIWNNPPGAFSGDVIKTFDYELTK